MKAKSVQPLAGFKNEPVLLRLRAAHLHAEGCDGLDGCGSLHCDVATLLKGLGPAGGQPLVKPRLQEERGDHERHNGHDDKGEAPVGFEGDDDAGDDGCARLKDEGQALACPALDFRSVCLQARGEAADRVDWQLEPGDFLAQGSAEGLDAQAAGQALASVDEGADAGDGAADDHD